MLLACPLLANDEVLQGAQRIVLKDKFMLAGAFERRAASLSTSLAVLGLGCGLTAPAFGQGGQVAGMPSMAPHVVVRVDSATRDVLVEFGPLDLPAHATHHDVKQPTPIEIAFPIDAWIEGYSGEVVDESGHKVPSAVIHHLNLIVPERRELFSTIMQRMGAAGAETPPVHMPMVLGHPLMGYQMHRGDSLLITLMLHNPTGESYVGSKLVVRLPFALSSAWPRPVAITPFYLDVMPPAARTRRPA